MVLEGAFQKRRFLDLLRYFIVFEDSAVDGGDGKLVKKMEARRGEAMAQIKRLLEGAVAGSV